MFKLDLFDIEQDLITSTSIEGDTLDSIRENLTLAIKSVEGENPYTCVLIAKATEESWSWKVGGSTGILDDFIESNFYGSFTYNQYMSYLDTTPKDEHEKLLKHVNLCYHLEVIDAVAKIKDTIAKEFDNYLDDLRQTSIDEAIANAGVITYYKDVIQYFDDLSEYLVSSCPLRDINSNCIGYCKNNGTVIDAVDKLIADGGILERMYNTVNIITDAGFIIEDQGQVLYYLFKEYSEQ